MKLRAQLIISMVFFTVTITAYALHGDKEKCLEAGMDGYIAKPVQKEDLAKVLEKFG